MTKLKDRIHDLANMKIVQLRKVATTLDPPANKYLFWTRGGFIIHILKHEGLLQ